MRRIEDKEQIMLLPLIRHAEKLTLSSPCQKSQRAAIIFQAYPTRGQLAIISEAINGREDNNCGGPNCRELCRFIDHHAERRAMQLLLDYPLEVVRGASLLHIKRKGGEIVPVSSLECIDCSSFANRLNYQAGVNLNEIILQDRNGYLALSIDEWYELSKNKNDR